MVSIFSTSSSVAPFSSFAMPPMEQGTSRSHLRYSRRMSIAVKRKFRVNGKEYDSIDQIPPELRGAVEQALGRRRSAALGWAVARLAVAAALLLLRYR